MYTTYLKDGNTIEKHYSKSRINVMKMKGTDMTVQQAAIAAINDESAKPSGKYSVEDACFKIAELAETKPMGYILNDEEYAMVRDCLATIGNCETSISEDGSLEGKADIEYEIEGNGLNVKMNAHLSCEGVWDRARMQWIGNVGVQKVSGTEQAMNLKFTFRYLSFGLTPEGKPVLQYNYSFVRDQRANEFVKLFNEGERVESAHVGTSKDVQWGFCIVASCKITTSESTVIV